MLQESGTRETRPAARELKFLVRPDVADEILTWSRARLAPDPHGSGPFGDDYRTTSLYFDTAGLDVYHRRGSFGRSKYRIRRYGNNGLVFLERKLRTGNVLTKRRTPIATAALRSLESAVPDASWPGHWFRRRIEARMLRPVCQITYHRVARAALTAEGPARLTVDQRVVARLASAPEFHPDGGGAAVLSTDVIVEMKFVGRPPALFRELVEALALEPFTISKYRLSIEALAHAGETPELPDAPATHGAADVVDA